jgi:hypothetical protein
MVSLIFIHKSSTTKNTLQTKKEKGTLVSLNMILLNLWLFNQKKILVQINQSGLRTTSIQHYWKRKVLLFEYSSWVGKYLGFSLAQSNRLRRLYWGFQRK